MKKILIALICMCTCIQLSAQRVYNEDGKYYEVGIVVYKSGSNYLPSTAYCMTASTCKGGYSDYIYKDESGKEVVFNNFSACISYFMCKGWQVLDINLDDNNKTFIIRKEITKDQAAKLEKDCIKEKK